ncbi:cGMP-dependent protein kinase 1-like isoform X1 [Cyprinus carpio]|uniref:cGMP-dependent protein kinase n=3 Tax=Cyprinus carpio TaxID=7962 RepID=A0A9Q9YEI1_CYPCA|nr:cGMP-dependent protein kinase 1-like isoform X1 [Cyprinus carpio]XP_042618723.1 cGMP-dependent protein kinase 1-like isoform X1 [Cyprinus carpio]
MGTLRDLQFALQLKIEELRQRDALIDELELELDAKDDLIRRLQDELDRLRLSAAGQQRASSLRVRRKALLTEPVTVEPKLVLQNPPISYSKSQESQRLIESALAENECMKYLIRDQMRCLVDSVYPITLKQGVSVVQEEDNGTQAYIVEEGKLEASRAGQRLHIIEPGMMFEELALIHNHTCSTTVTALVNSRLWVLEGQVFQKIMQRNGLAAITQSLDFLRSVALLCVFPEDVLMKVSDALEESQYSNGDYIIRNGIPGDKIFILSQGQVKVLEKHSASEESMMASVLSRGDCFGERGDDERSMSALAAGDVTCLVIDREVFEKVTGGLGNARENPTNKVILKADEDGSAFGETSLCSFQVLCNLGEGQYGHTQLVHLKSDPSCKFALKTIRKQLIESPGQRERILAEKHILMDLQSPFIVRLHCTYKDARCLYMLMEACEGGDLWRLLRERGSLQDNAVRFYAASVLEALHVLHTKDIVHRDLKPENVLLDQRGYAKLTGFGCAKKLGSLHRAWSFCGSVGYQPPEVILHQGHGLSVDLWALGMLLYELLSGSPLFSGSEQLKVYTAALKGIDELEFPKTISRTAAHLIKSLCRLNPSERLGQRNGVKDICKHMWFEGFDWEGLQKGTMTPPVKPNVSCVSDHGGSSLLPETHIEAALDNSGWDIDF